MKEQVAEVPLESAIEAALLAGGPDASVAPVVAETPPPFGEYAASRTSRWTPTSSTWRRISMGPGPGSCPSTSVRVNTPENARLTFDHVVTDRLQEMVDSNFKFYKRVTDDREFARFFVDRLFERFRKGLAE
jgi:hypothetical protein